MNNLTPQARRRAMRAVKSKRTGLERRIFAMLAGMRVSGWQQNPRGVVGNPDIVFSDRKIAIFIDGCFWHGCPVCRKKLPTTNVSYWQAKIARTIERDRENRQKLRDAGWTVLRIWEHEVKDPQARRHIHVVIRSSLNLNKIGGNA